jgi:hypothetical protein
LDSIFIVQDMATPQKDLQRPEWYIMGTSVNPREILSCFS